MDTRVRFHVGDAKSTSVPPRTGSLGSGAVTAAGLAVQQAAARRIIIALRACAEATDSLCGIRRSSCSPSLRMARAPRRRRSHALAARVASRARRSVSRGWPSSLSRCSGSRFSEPMPSRACSPGSTTASRGTPRRTPFPGSSRRRARAAIRRPGRERARGTRRRQDRGHRLRAEVLGLVFILSRIGRRSRRGRPRGSPQTGLVAVAVPAIALAHEPDAGAVLVTRGDLRRPGARLAAVVSALRYRWRAGRYRLASRRCECRRPRSLGYAYIAGSAVIAITSSALALVTSVPLGSDPAQATRHVVVVIGFIAWRRRPVCSLLSWSELAEAVLGCVQPVRSWKARRRARAVDARHGRHRCCLSALVRRWTGPILAVRVAVVAAQLPLDGRSGRCLRSCGSARGLDGTSPLRCGFSAQRGSRSSALPVLLRLRSSLSSCGTARARARSPLRHRALRRSSRDHAAGRLRLSWSYCGRCRNHGCGVERDVASAQLLAASSNRRGASAVSPTTSETVTRSPLLDRKSLTSSGVRT